MKYQVPQFIEIEDKIFGPFTFKQFIYLVGGAGICFMAYKLLPLIYGIFIMLPAIGISASLAFYRPNNRPLIDMVEAAFNYGMTSKLYIWRKEDKKIEPKTTAQLVDAVKSSVIVPRLSDSKLKDLAWSLDINETVFSKDTGRLENKQGLKKMSF
jgi:hypothetical protein